MRQATSSHPVCVIGARALNMLPRSPHSRVFSQNRLAWSKTRSSCFRLAKVLEYVAYGKQLQCITVRLGARLVSRPYKRTSDVGGEWSGKRSNCCALEDSEVFVKKCESGSRHQLPRLWNDYQMIALDIYLQIASLFVQLPHARIVTLADLITLIAPKYVRIW